MKSTLSLLKIGASANINSIKNPSNLNKHKIERLYSAGVAPGRKVTLLNKKNDLFIAQVDLENPFCLRQDLAELIEINTNQNNIFKNLKERENVESFLYLIRTYIAKLHK